MSIVRFKASRRENFVAGGALKFSDFLVEPTYGEESFFDEFPTFLVMKSTLRLRTDLW